MYDGIAKLQMRSARADKPSATIFMHIKWGTGNDNDICVS